MKIKFEAKLNGKEVVEIADTDTMKEVLTHYILHLIEEESIEEKYTEVEVVGFEISSLNGEVKDYAGGCGNLEVEL